MLLSGVAVDGVATQIFSPVLQGFRAGVGEIGGCAAAAARDHFAGNPLWGRIWRESEMSAGTFVAGKTGFFFAGTRIDHVPAWLLVIRTLGAPELGRVILLGFLLAPFSSSMAPLTGAAA